MPVLQFLSLLRSTSTTSSAPYATLALLLSKNRSAPLRLARNRLAPSTPKKPPCLLPLRLHRQLRNAASCLSSPHRAPPPSRPGHPRHSPRLCPASRPTSPPCRLCSTTPSQRRLPRPRAGVARRPAFVSLCPRPADPRRRDVVAGGEEEVGETAGAGGGRGEAGPARAEHEDEDITSFFHQCALPPWTAELELTAPSTVSMTLALTCLNMMSTILASLLPSKHIGNRQLLSLLIAIHTHPRRPRHGAHDELHTATPSVLLLPKSSTHRPRHFLHNSHTISWKVFPPPPLFLRLGGHIDRGVRALSGFILSHQTELGQQIEN